MKKNIISIIFLIPLLVSILAAAPVRPPTNLSLKGLAEWTERGGFLASGSGALPAVASSGSRYTDLSTPTAPIDYRSNGSSWIAISGAGTPDHAALSGLEYSAAGHYDFPSLASMAEKMDLNPASMSIGSGVSDASIARTASGTLAISSYTVFIPELATPTDSLATGTFWYDKNQNKARIWDGASWRDLW